MREILATKRERPVMDCDRQRWNEHSADRRRRGIRRFRLRGLLNVTSEWKLICATQNLLTLFRHRMTPALA